MRINIRLFAILRELAGTDALTLELNDACTVRDARNQLAEKFPSLATSIATAAFAINREYVSLDTRLKDCDELALIPPVSGG